MREPYRLDLLGQHLHNPKHPQCFIGYSTTAKTRQFPTSYGIWIGYQSGKPFIQMQFKDRPAWAKVNNPLNNYLTSMNAMFEGFSRWIDRDFSPLILVPTIHLVNVMRANSLWKKSIDFGDKARMFKWVDLYHPVYEVYDANIPPFSILKEIADIDKRETNHKIARKQLLDMSDLREDPAPTLT